MTFSLDSAFYVFNLVANYAYSRWDAIYPDVHAAIVQREANYKEMVVVADETATAMFAAGKTDAAVEYLTSFSVDIGDALLKDW